MKRKIVMADESNAIAQERITFKVKRAKEELPLDVIVLVDNVVIYDGPIALMSFDEWSVIELPIAGEF